MEVLGELGGLELSSQSTVFPAVFCLLLFLVVIVLLGP